MPRLRVFHVEIPADQVPLFSNIAATVTGTYEYPDDPGTRGCIDDVSSIHLKIDGEDRIPSLDQDHELYDHAGFLSVVLDAVEKFDEVPTTDVLTTQSIRDAKDWLSGVTDPQLTQNEARALRSLRRVTPALDELVSRAPLPFDVEIFERLRTLGLVFRGDLRGHLTYIYSPTDAGTRLLMEMDDD